MGIPAFCCIKYLVFFFSMLLAMAGTALIVVGFLLIARYHTFLGFLNEKFAALPYLILLVGILLFITSFLGCCGVLKDNHCFLTAFASLLLILLLLGTIASILTLVFDKNIRNLIKERMDYTLSRTPMDSKYNASWDVLQSSWKCCGKDGFADWGPAPYPSSCCPDVDPRVVDDKDPDGYENNSDDSEENSKEDKKPPKEDKKAPEVSKKEEKNVTETNNEPAEVSTESADVGKKGAAKNTTAEKDENGEKTGGKVLTQSNGKNSTEAKECTEENVYKVGCLDMLNSKIEELTFPMVLLPILLGLIMYFLPIESTFRAFIFKLNNIRKQQPRVKF